MDKNNETAFKPFVKNKSNSKDKSKNINKKNTSLFLSKTFASKLFLKLTSSILDPIIVCLQTLKFEPENRKKEEIENTIPYLKTLDNFYDFITFNENEKTVFELMVKFARITFYQYYRKYTILKRPGTSNDKFYILLSGSINKYSLIFEKENLTLEQYLLYLVKLIIINEDEIIKKCNILNKDIINAGKDEFSISNFFKMNKKLNYKEYLLKAEKELIKLGFNSNLYQGGILKRVPSIENYLKVFDSISSKSIENGGKPKFNLWIGKYKLTSVLVKGQFFNNISDERIKEYNIYLCNTNCDIGQISREEYIETNLNTTVKFKMKNIFKEIKNNFYFLRGMDDERFIQEYSHLLLYKKYKKGDKIFLQGGLYEGVYIIFNGEISLSTKISMEKLGHLLISVIYSIKSFSEHIPAFNSNKLIEEFNKKHQLLYSEGNIPFIELATPKNFEISKVKENDIIGLCESYDYKTEIFNYSAECISDEATIFFITKNDFSLMLSRETSLYNTILPIIEYKIQIISGKLRSFSEQTFKIFVGRNKRSKINNQTKAITNINENRLNKSKSINNKFNKKKKVVLNNSKFNSSINNSNNIFNISNYNNSNFNNSNFSNFNNSSSAPIKQNLSILNYSMRPCLIKNSDKQKEKDKIKNLGILNKFNYFSNYNDNNSTSIFYKTLNTKKNNSIFKSDYTRFNSLNDGFTKRKKLNNNYNIDYDIDQFKFNSTETKFLYNDNLINSFRGNSINNIINSSRFHLPSFSNNNFIKTSLTPSFNENINNYEKVKLFPILKNKRNFNKNIK